MKKNSYSNIIKLYNEINDEQITKEELCKKYRNRKNKIFLKNQLLKFCEKRIIDLLNDFKNYEENVPQNLINNYKNIKKMNVFFIKNLDIKIKKYEELYDNACYLLGEVKINYYRNGLLNLKQIIIENGMSEYFKYSLEEIEFLLDELETGYINVRINTLEDEYIEAIKNIGNMINDTINENIEKNNISSDNESIVEQKEIDNVVNFEENIENTKYQNYINNSLHYFDVVKLEIVKLNLDEEKEIEMLNYIDGLKQEYIYLFSTTLDYNDKNNIIKMLMSFDKLVKRKLDNYNNIKTYTKKAS